MVIDPNTILGVAQLGGAVLGSDGGLTLSAEPVLSFRPCAILGIGVLGEMVLGNNDALLASWTGPGLSNPSQEAVFSNPTMG